MNLSYSTKLKKVGGKLVHVRQADSDIFDSFKDMVPEGSVIELFVQVVSEDGNLAQLAKVHAMIRALSKHTGNTFDEMKMLVKKKAGLCIVYQDNGEEKLQCKSFGDCCMEELSAAIKAAQEIGIQVNHPLPG